MVGLDLHVDVTLAYERPLALTVHASGGRVAVVGPSGSGKSTLLRVLAGLEPRARGTVQVRGETWQSGSGPGSVPAWSRRVGWSPQDAALFPHVDVRQNLLWNVTSRDGLEELTTALGIDALLDRRPRNLSGGERARVSLGRALLSRPRLLLLDEPLAALDRARRTDVAKFLRAHCSEHEIPYLVVSHDDRDVSVLADETIALG